MLERQPEDPLVKLVKTVETVETEKITYRLTDYVTT